MPRRNRSRSSESAARAPYGRAERERWRDEAYLVLVIPGAAATKAYRCPGCDQEIRPGTAHRAVWSEDGDGDDRRHWHTACWAARDRRAPGVVRSRNAPRYGRRR